MNIRLWFQRTQLWRKLWSFEFVAEKTIPPADKGRGDPQVHDRTSGSKKSFRLRETPYGDRTFPGLMFIL